jgi:RimJ/RimL family protein N-acetyltransferase
MSETSTRSPGPAYRVTTNRLVIRCWNPSDAPLLKDSIDRSIEHLRPWMPWAMNEPSPVEARVQWLRHCRAEFDLGRDFTYGIFAGDERTVIGGTGLHTRQGPAAREIGYWIGAAHVRQGYATETAAALTRVAFLVDGVDRVEIHCDPRNTASAAVPRSLGYACEATLKCRVKGSDGLLHDSMIWTMMKEAFADSPCAQAALEAYDVIGGRLL